MRLIASHVGLSTSAGEKLAVEALVRLDRPRAAHVLAVAATSSLAFGSFSPSRPALADAREALVSLADDAVFFSNGYWDVGISLSWNSITSATFDCGIIGFDANSAFIFWVEEED